MTSPVSLNGKTGHPSCRSGFITERFRMSVESSR
uniref:Uncharacterized protein n=1 Tax=Anguilla anguilla TaxID=7936 RepID=A0A0E9RVW5_ANGAN